MSLGQQSDQAVGDRHASRGLYEVAVDPARGFRQPIFAPGWRTRSRCSGLQDLTRVLDVLRNYHRIAWLTQRQGPEAHQRMLDHVEHALRTGEAPPGSVSAEEMKALIRRQLSQ